MTRIRTKDKSGLPVKGWRFGTMSGISTVGGRRVKGWVLIDPDGYQRFCEGNWQQFVPFANLILENHGLSPTLS